MERRRQPTFLRKPWLKPESNLQLTNKDLLKINFQKKKGKCEGEGETAVVSSEAVA